MSELTLNETNDVSGGVLVTCAIVGAIVLGAAASFAIGAAMADEGCCDCGC